MRVFSLAVLSLTTTVILASPMALANKPRKHISTIEYPDITMNFSASEAKVLRNKALKMRDNMPRKLPSSQKRTNNR